MPIHSPDLFARAAAAVKKATGIGYPLGQVRKAIAGGLAGAIPLLTVDIADLHISDGEARGLAVAFILGALAVFHISNTPAPPADGE